VPGRSLSRPISVVNCELRERMLTLSAKTCGLANERPKRRLRLLEAAANQDFAAPGQLETDPGMRNIPEIPASADVAQLVEHFTRNVSVHGLSLSDGFPARRQESSQMQGVRLDGGLPRRGRQHPRIDTAAAQFAAPLQHRCAPCGRRPSNTGRRR
jgi:hypothetical protein